MPLFLLLPYSLYSRFLWVMPVQWYFIDLGRTTHHSRDITLKRRKLGLPDEPEVASSSFPVCTDSLGATGSLLYYDFGSYDQPFVIYSAKKSNYAKIMATLSQNYGNPISIG